MNRVLLLEDDQSLGESLKQVLSKTYQIDWAQDLASAKKFANEHQFEVMILDVGLPDGSGFELAEMIRQRSPQTQFLFLTAFSDAETRLRGFEVGAADFIPKPFHLKELQMRLQHLFENHIQKNRLLNLGDHQIDFEAMTINGKSNLLSSSEFRVLKTLVLAGSRVLSRDEIINAVYGEEADPSHRTIDNMIAHIRGAIGDKEGKIIRSVRGVGYQFLGPSTERKI